jgi:NAD(P)-dependent dehydrogenase (short-subunit alcohol dehydrogenase family)
MSDTVLAGKVAIVTGAGGGIGQAICLTFATAGAKVACLDIDLAPAEKTAAELKQGRRPQRPFPDSGRFTFWSTLPQPTTATAPFSISRVTNGRGCLPSM